MSVIKVKGARSKKQQNGAQPIFTTRTPTSAMTGASESLDELILQTRRILQQEHQDEEEADGRVVAFQSVEQAVLQLQQMGHTHSPERIFRTITGYAKHFAYGPLKCLQEVAFQDLVIGKRLRGKKVIQLMY